MSETLLHMISLVGHLGYLIIFIAAFLESSAFMGLLVPGESVVVLSGFLALQGYLEIGDLLWVVYFTRSRAYHKDDNAHVEQKNWTHIRQWLGYQRLDDPRAVHLLNDLYTKEWRFFHNFFCPSMKLISKERIGSKTIKHHDPPKTPYQRTLQSPYVLLSVKNSLSKQLEQLNPFVLRKAMENKLNRVLKPFPKHSLANDPLR